ncbi:type II toxin-antitoxin system VapC family toxin [Nocardia alni]|uniref:type II toxin-antitoxin system VapC family toxin n=1 Tax=Nocardia alni TaxID=2815723 RepID=UPI001C210ABC|nr:type II toxin-antitoxin system VapC family toxin [Nocardia alni]
MIVGEAEVCRIGAPTLVETGLVITNKAGPLGKPLLAAFLQERDFDVVAFGVEHWRAAQTAFLRFGKGRHPAALNFGDCLTYAVAWASGELLLCIGDDFKRTDLDLVEL